MIIQQRYCLLQQCQCILVITSVKVYKVVYEGTKILKPYIDFHIDPYYQVATTQFTDIDAAKNTCITLFWHYYNLIKWLLNVEFCVLVNFQSILI